MTLGTHNEEMKLNVLKRTVLRLDFLLVGLIFRGEFFGLGNHAIDVGLRQTALLVGDRDLVRFFRGAVRGGHVQNTVRVHVEDHLSKGFLHIRY